MENGTKENRMCRRDANEGANSKIRNLRRWVFCNNGKQKSQGHIRFLFILILFQISQGVTVDPNR